MEGHVLGVLSKRGGFTHSLHLATLHKGGADSTAVATIESDGFPNSSCVGKVCGPRDNRDTYCACTTITTYMYACMLVCLYAAVLARILL